MIGTSSSCTSSFWHPAYANPRHDRTNTDGRVLFVDALVEQTVRGIAVVAHIDVDQANREETARDNLVLHAVQVVVHAGKTVLHVPHQDGSETRSCRHLAMIFVLEDPAHVGTSTRGRTLALCGGAVPLRNGEQLVLSEPRVHERVHESGGQVRAGAIYGSPGWSAAFHQVRLVNVFGRLRFHDVEVSRERQIVPAEVRVAHDVLKLLELVFVCDLTWALV